MKPDMNGRENGDGRDAGLGDAPKGAPPGLCKRQRFLCMLSPPFFRLLSISVQGNGVWRGVSNGAGGVLLASMGGMPGQATPQKVRLQALANANVSFVYFLLRFYRLLSISVQWNGVCSRVSKGLEVYC